MYTCTNEQIYILMSVGACLGVLRCRGGRGDASRVGGPVGLQLAGRGWVGQALGELELAGQRLQRRAGKGHGMCDGKHNSACRAGMACAWLAGAGLARHWGSLNWLVKACRERFGGPELRLG